MSTTTKKASTKGVRYTDSQKKEVVDFAVNYNTANGRGGQSKAAEKFGISQLTIATWLKASGAPSKASAKAPTTVKVAKAPKAKKGGKKAAKKAAPAVSGSVSAKLSELLALSNEIAGVEANLAKLQAKFNSLKASL